MDEDNTFEELIDSIEPTSSGSISQNALEPGTLIVTNYPPKRVKKDPFWNELTEVGDKRHCNLCNKAYRAKKCFRKQKIQSTQYVTGCLKKMPPQVSA